MKVKRVEHVDDFNEYEHIFWLEVDDVPNQLIELAKKIDGEEFLETCFGICVMCNENNWCICQDDIDCELFYIDNDGEKHWFECKLTELEVSKAIEFCKNNLQEEE